MSTDRSDGAHDIDEHWVPVDGGFGLHAVLRRPGRIGPRGAPAVSMAHGFGAIKERGLTAFAEHFVDAGFAVLVHDHRSFGRSGGWPRRDVDPWRQILDWRRVITYLQGLDGVDPDRIGVWGSSFAGGHALVLGGSDRRIGAVVSQIPTISGYEQSLRRVPPERRPEVARRFRDDEAAQLRGAEPARQLLNSLDPDEPATYHDSAWDAFEKMFPTPAGQEQDRTVTLRSTLKAQMYDPGVWVDRVAPTPLLMVVGAHDQITPTDLALAAYDRAGEPKRLVVYDGGHFDAYVEQFAVTGDAARDWFVHHLLPDVEAGGGAHPGSP